MYKDLESTHNPSNQRESSPVAYHQSRGPSHLTQDEATDLRMLLKTELKDIYWAEMAIVDALPRIAQQAISDELQKAIIAHWEESRKHVEHLERAFGMLSEKMDAERCEGMAGLIAEAETMSGLASNGKVRDAAIISALQKIEHYEISAYGTMVAFADTLGESKVANLLQSILDEEKAADRHLTRLAMSSINAEATKKPEKKIKEEKPEKHPESPTLPEEDSGEFEKRTTHGEEQRTPNTTGELNQTLENPDIEQEHIRNNRGKQLDNPSTYLSEATGSPDEEKDM